MKKLLLLLTIALAFAGCSKDEECSTCEGLYVNNETGEEMHQPKDCNTETPAGYTFVECITPDYKKK